MFTALPARAGVTAELAADCDMVSSRRYLSIKTLDVKTLAPVAPRLRNSFRRDAQLLQQLDQALALGLGQPARCSLERSCVLREDAADVSPSGGREADDPRPSVRVVVCARVQSARLEPIDGGRDRPAREIDAAADVVDLLRPLAQQDLEHGEVGQAEPRRLDALHRVPGEGAMGLHQDEPEMDARALGSICHGGASESAPDGAPASSCVRTGRSSEWTPGESSTDGWSTSRAPPSLCWRAALASSTSRSSDVQRKRRTP